MDSSRESTRSTVSLKEALDLVDHVIEAARLEAVGRGHAVSVHRVGNPQWARIGRLDSFQQRRQGIADGARTHARNESEATRFAIRIEFFDQCTEVIRARAGAELDTDGVAHARQEINVCTVELTCALANPHEVCRRVVRLRCARIDASHGTLVVHQ